MKSQGLIANTMILTATSFITRTVGMISIVYISNALGPEGMGLYQLIMSIYIMAVIFASAGISVSVSKLVAEELSRQQFESAKQIMTIVFLFGGLLSSLICMLLFTYAPQIALIFIKDPRATWGLRMLSLSIPFMALSSCFKGYFYAVKRVIKPASADVLEQFVKLGLIMILVNLWSPRGLAYAYAAIGIAMTIGEMVSWSYMLTFYILDHRRYGVASRTSSDAKGILLRLLGVALPVAAIAYISSVFMSLENVLIPIGLRKFGATQEASMSLYGMVKGMVLPILFFPAAFLTAFSTTLVPEIARANTLRHYKTVRHTTHRVLHFTFILSIFVVSIFMSYSQELGVVIYKNEQIGPILKTLALIVPFMYIEVVSDGILKGLGKQMSCLKYSIIDSIFRISMIYFLIPIKGISAFLAIMILSNTLTCSLNFNRLLETANLNIEVSKWILKPAIAATASVLFSKYFMNCLTTYALPLLIQCIISIALSTLIYIILLFLIECLTPVDMQWLRRSIRSFIASYL
ncbi:putative polysaccharide biosynthesis protein [Cellulosilyticum sp. I15G10I2]|uniref:putative polysaccharide biosynthesis protein n=1 Tax=Cellulosilyticum sp. I15G10I2 TaxID=1892843 RepID=UPI00085C77D5|nr:polysaccharide biosynthesis protein [Cellulosilyticum sp. I15G10I2]